MTKNPELLFRMKHKVSKPNFFGVLISMEQMFLYSFIVWKNAYHSILLILLFSYTYFYFMKLYERVW